MARRLEAISSCSKAILYTFNSLVCTTEPEEDAQPRKVQVCRRTDTTPISEVPVQLRLSESLLRIIAQHESATQKQSVLCANGLTEVILDQLLTVLVINEAHKNRIGQTSHGLLRTSGTDHMCKRTRRDGRRDTKRQATVK